MFRPTSQHSPSLTSTSPARALLFDESDPLFALTKKMESTSPTPMSPTDKKALWKRKVAKLKEREASSPRSPRFEATRSTSFDESDPFLLPPAAAPRKKAWGTTLVGRGKASRGGGGALAAPTATSTAPLFEESDPLFALLGAGVGKKKWSG